MERRVVDMAFSFDGKRLRERDNISAEQVIWSSCLVVNCTRLIHALLRQAGLEDGDSIFVQFIQVGNIGVFARKDELAQSSPGALLRLAQDTPGAAWLMQPDFPQTLSSLEVAYVAAQMSDSVGCQISAGAQVAPLVDVAARVLLSRDACISLVRAVDAAYEDTRGCDSGTARRTAPGGSLRGADMGALAGSIAASSRADDFKLVLRDQAGLEQLLGKSEGAVVYQALTALLGVRPDALAIRRTVGTGRWISWHTDFAARTVQVTDYPSCLHSLSPACLLLSSFCSSSPGTPV